ncbi:MAG: hypothetical protein GY810_16345 [Aureispira sp.]|nr:hypothetical protein [Aureispira sp.]
MDMLDRLRKLAEDFKENYTEELDSQVSTVLESAKANKPSHDFFEALFALYGSSKASGVEDDIYKFVNIEYPLAAANSLCMMIQSGVQPTKKKAIDALVKIGREVSGGKLMQIKLTKKLPPIGAFPLADAINDQSILMSHLGSAALEHTDEYTRAKAISAIGNLAKSIERFKPLILKVQKDSSEWVQTDAKTALEYLEKLNTVPEV